MARGTPFAPRSCRCNDQTKIIFSTAFPSFDNAIKAIRSGASDYLSKPYNLEELSLSVRQAFRTLELENVEQIQDYQSTRESEDSVLIGGEGLSETKKLVGLAATSDSPVLITGETGTGKTLVAKAIHYRGPSPKSPFISINCASLPETLIEAELFGYEKGAYTGAVASRKGLFEMAEGGTLFLDEIGEMPIHLQAKLLSVLEDKKLRRLGSESVRTVSVRIIAATGVNLEDHLGKTFRKDLYYRLSVIRMHIPPLRERCTDIPQLCCHLMKAISGGHEVLLSEAESARMCQLRLAGERPGTEEHPRTRLPAPERSRSSGPLICSARHNCGRKSTGTGSDADEPLLALEDVEMRHIRYALSRLSAIIHRQPKPSDISLSTLKRKLKMNG